MMYKAGSLPFLTCLACLWSFSYGQGKTTVNLVVIYDLNITRTIFEAARSAIVGGKVKTDIAVGDVIFFPVNPKTMEATKLIEHFCEVLDEAIGSAKKPDLVLDLTRQGLPSEAVKVTLKALRIPTIAATFGQEGDIREWRNLSEKEKMYLVQVSPPADVLIQSVRSFVQIQKMTSAVILFDPVQYKMAHKYQTLLQNEHTRHLIVKLEEHEYNVKDQLKRLKDLHMANFFVAARGVKISEVLRSAADIPIDNRRHFFDEEHSWYSMDLEENLVGLKCCPWTKISSAKVVHLSPDLTLMKKSPRYQLLGTGLRPESLTQIFYLDLCLNAILTIGAEKKDGKMSLLNEPIKCSNYNYTKAQEASHPTVDLITRLSDISEAHSMMKLNLSTNGRNIPKFNMKITQLLFSPGQNSQGDIGTWESVKVETGKDAVTYNQSKDLSSHVAHNVYRVVTVVQPPFVYKIPKCIPDPKTFKHCYEGYCIDMLNLMQKDMDFNYTIYDVPDYGFMNETYPHEWSGLVREMKDRRADIGLGAISLMIEREEALDFTIPYYELVGVSVLMKKQKLPSSMFKFLTVLENDVWMCIIAAYFFTSILMWIFDRWSPYSYQNNKEKYEDDEEKREFNLKECLWFCMTSLTPQGGGEAPKNLSGRLVAATWWLFGFIIIASYTANLAAFLTVSRLEKPIETLEDLSKQYKIQYATRNGSAAYMYFDRMAHIEHLFYEIWKDMSLNDSLTEYERAQLAVWEYPVSDKFTKMWQAMTENKFPYTYDGAIRRVRSVDNVLDNFAFLDDATNVRYEVLSRCDVYFLNEEFARKPYALAVQKGSPILEEMNRAITKLTKNRQLERLKTKWWKNNKYRARNCPKEYTQADGISIHNIGGVFVVILAGFILTFITLFLEYVYYSLRWRAKNRPDGLVEFLPSTKAFAPATLRVDNANFNTQYDRPT